MTGHQKWQRKTADGGDVGLAVGVDVGGTKIAAGLVDDAGAVQATVRRATPSAGPAEVVDTIVDLVRELGAGAHGVPVGIGAAGFVDAGRSRVLFAPNLAWRDEPLAEAVGARLNVAVVVENDANAAAWAEARFGAGAGESSIVCVTVGTGIGGGVVLDGALLRGRFGIAGEFGHLPLVAGGIRCRCGQYGCWEQYGSGNALARTGRDLLAVGGADALLQACAGDPDKLTGSMITEAAAAGDRAAVALVAELGAWLGAGMAAVAAVLDPGCFVLGGGVAESGELLLKPVREAYRRRLPAVAHRPLAEIRAAGLGNEAGLVGAADLARLGAR